MSTHTIHTTHTDLNTLSGEQLLMMAVFGPRDTKPRIDRELDRRASVDPTPTFPAAASLTRPCPALAA